MPSLKQLAARALTLLRAQPILWTPPLGIALLSSLLLPTGTAPMAILLVVTGLISLAVTAGWYALIARADEDVRPTWDDFFVAIGRHFSPLILGTALFFLLVGIVAIPTILGGTMWAGPDMLTKLQTQLPALLDQAQTHPEVLGTIDPALVTALNRLVIAFAGAVTWYTLVNVVLLFWKQALVLGHQGWWQSWRTSLSLLREHFGLVMGLLTIEAVAYLVAGGMSLLPFPLGAFGWLGMIAVHVWATTAYTLVYTRAYPPVKTAGEATASPSGLAS